MVLVSWAEAKSEAMMCKSYQSLDKSYRRLQQNVYCENMYVPCYYTRSKDVHDEIQLRHKIPTCVERPQPSSSSAFSNDVGLFQVPITTEGTARVRECKSCDCRSAKHQLFGNTTRRH